MSFLAFKAAEIPVGRTITANFTQIATDILERHYRPSSTYLGYYNPFLTSDPQNRWTAERYPSTSLQRITKDTFGDTLLHPSRTEWGWQKDYVHLLSRHLPGKKIPAFELGVWLFRDENWPDETIQSDIVQRFFSEYHITEAEADSLFTMNNTLPLLDWLEPTPVFESDLLDITGQPPGSLPQVGAALKRLTLREIGPAKRFTYNPAMRLNVITGDNSLGKTFLLEAIWWSLTGEWTDQALTPRTDVAKSTPIITFELTPKRGSPRQYSSTYDWQSRKWKVLKDKIAAGLVVYARHDGSFALWDPARPAATDSDPSQPLLGKSLIFSRNDIWYGLSDSKQRDRVCNGLLRDRGCLADERQQVSR